MSVQIWQPDMKDGKDSFRMTGCLLKPRYHQLVFKTGMRRSQSNEAPMN